MDVYMECEFIYDIRRNKNNEKKFLHLYFCRIPIRENDLFIFYVFLFPSCTIYTTLHFSIILQHSGKKGRKMVSAFFLLYTYFHITAYMLCRTACQSVYEIVCMWAGVEISYNMRDISLLNVCTMLL